MADDFIFIAHRGASAACPENTLLAFRKALEAGATWLELDVHLSVDGALLVIHDETLHRTTNGRGAVNRQSVEQLRQLDAGQGEPIPLLEEVLELAAGRATVNIELKGQGTAAPVAELLCRRLAAGLLRREEILASSLNEKELIAFAGQQLGIRLAPIADRPNRRFWTLADRLDAWSVHLEKSSVSKALIERVHSRGRKLLVFTVNEMESVQRLRSLGVDGVFSDRPELFMSW